MIKKNKLICYLMVIVAITESSFVGCEACCISSFVAFVSELVPLLYRQVSQLRDQCSGIWPGEDVTDSFQHETNIDFNSP